MKFIEELNITNNKGEEELYLLNFIEKEIDKISDLQFLNGIDAILTAIRLEQEKKRTTTHPILEQENQRWQESKNINQQLIHQSLINLKNYFEQRFENINPKPDLSGFDTNSAFANNIVGHYRINPKDSIGIMRSLCDYIASLHYVEDMRVINALQSFPPQSLEDIACLGGSGARTDALIKRLNVLPGDTNLYDIHEKISSQITSKFNKTVSTGNQIHSLPCVSFCLGVESKEVIINHVKDPNYKLPRANISTHLAYEELTKYYQSFREYLKKELANNLSTKIQEKISDFRKYNAHQLAMGLTQEDKDIMNTLGVNEGNINLSSLMSGDDIYVWDEEKIASHTIKRELARLFPNYPNPEIAYISETEQQLLTRLNNCRNLFDATATSDILYALKNSSNEQILHSAIRNLWIIGAKFKGGSPIIFTNIIKNLIPKIFITEEDAKIIQLNPELAKKLSIADRNKVDEIQELYYFHIKNKIVTDYNDLQSQNRSLKDYVMNLLKGNASYQEIVVALQNCSNYAPNTNITLQIHDIAKSLVIRPDFIDILRQIHKRNMFLSISSVNNLTQEAIINRKSDVLHFLMFNFGFNTTPKSLIGSLVDRSLTAMSFGDDDEALFLLKTAKSFADDNYENENLKLALDKQNHNLGTCLIHAAAAKGNVAIIDFLFENGADLNKRISIHPSTQNPFRTVAFQTPMHLAAFHGKTNSIKRLKELGAKCDEHDSNFRRPIYYAIKYGYSIALKELIRREENDEQTVNLHKCKGILGLYEVSPINVAIDYAQPQCLKELLNSGLEPNAAELNKAARQTIDQIIRTENSNNRLINNTDIRSRQDQLLEIILRQGAQSQYSNTITSNREIIIKHDHFSSIADAIIRSSVKNIFTNSFFEGKALVNIRDIADFKSKICKQLIKTYDYNVENMLEDFGLANHSQELPRFKLTLEEKYPNSSYDRVETLGKILAAKITTQKELTFLKIEKTTLRLSDANKDSFIDLITDRESIKNAPPPALTITSKPLPKIRGYKNIVRIVPEQPTQQY